MKYIVVLGDGMAGEKLSVLNNKTSLEYAKTPNLDALAPLSEVGLSKNVPEGLAPGSDVANMAVMGFDPLKYYTGRSPLEAVSLGINVESNEVTLRCNFVTLSDEENYEYKTMVDYSSGDIPNDEAAELIACLKKEFDNEIFTLYLGMQYRHCLVAKGIKTGAKLTPPHDISDKKIASYLPAGENAETYLAMMKRSSEILRNHPVNLKRIKEGKNPANSIWLWGEGTKPALENFETLRNLKGGLISAVDLVKGIGVLAGLKLIDVDGATGNCNTNFAGKANAAADELLNGLDFVYIHIDAPDECGHHGDYKNKIKSIELIDQKVIGTLIKRFKAAGEDFAMLVCPDHPTPCDIKTHTANPVPYLLYSTVKNLGNGAKRYTESEAESTKTYIPDGYKMIDKLFDIK